MPRSMKNPRKSPAEWQAIVERQEKSGLTGPMFCQREGIPYTSFLFGRRLVRRGPEPKFVALSPTAPSGWEIEVALPHGVILRFRG